MRSLPKVLVATREARQVGRLVSAIRYSFDCHVAVVDEYGELFALLYEQHFDILLLDEELASRAVMMSVELVSGRNPGLAVLVMTEGADPASGLLNPCRGAIDFVLNSQPERIVEQLGRVLTTRLLRGQSNRIQRDFLQNRLENPELFAKIITTDQKMFCLMSVVESVARSPSPVLLTGEQGTGKSLFAAAVHTAGGRAGPLVVEDLAGLDELSFADMLFGHVQGAFPGAVGIRTGLVEKAAGGTLVLNGIGELGLKNQARLLRLLEHNEYYRLGSDVPTRCGARLVLTCSRNLDELMSLGLFRRDLYFRLATHEVVIPPLRDRTCDIPVLVNHFASCSAVDTVGGGVWPADEVLRVLEGYSFPGNVQELKSIVLHALEATSGSPLRVEHLAGYTRQLDDLLCSADTVGGPGIQNAVVFGRELPSMRKTVNLLIDEALRRTAGNQTEAALLTGVTPSAISKRLKRRGSG